MIEEGAKASMDKAVADKKTADLLQEVLMTLETDKPIHKKVKMETILKFIFKYFYSLSQFREKNYKSNEEFEIAISDFRFRNLSLQIPKIGTAKKASEIQVETIDKKKVSINQIKNNAYLIIELGSRVLNVVTPVIFDKDNLDFLGNNKNQTIFDGSQKILRFDKFLDGETLLPEIQNLEDFLREKEESNKPSTSEEDSESVIAPRVATSISNSRDSIYRDYIFWEVINEIVSTFYPHGLCKFDPTNTDKEQLTIALSEIKKWAIVNKNTVLEPIGKIELSVNKLEKRRQLPMLSYDDIIDSSLLFITIATQMVNIRVKVIFNQREIIIGPKLTDGYGQETTELLETPINIDKLLPFLPF